MYNPRFRDAHGTDDHYMSANFVVGASKENEVGYLTSMEASKYGKLPIYYRCLVNV